MYVNSVCAGAVEISRKGPECALQVRRAASHVVPGIPDLIASRWIERQRVAIAVERAVERHARINPVIQSAFDNIGKLCVPGCGEHAPVPHHVADGSATLAVRAEVW